MARAAWTNILFTDLFRDLQIYLQTPGAIACKKQKNKKSLQYHFDPLGAAVSRRWETYLPQ